MKKTLLLLLAALVLTAASGCGGDGDDGDGDGSASGESSSSGGSTSGEQTCDEKHSCINGACQCDAGPKQGQSCCDPDDDSCTTDKCDSFCEYCS
jgi:hypothetical protein